MVDTFPLQSEIAAQKSIVGKNYVFFIIINVLNIELCTIFIYARYSAWETFRYHLVIVLKVITERL